MKSCEGLFRRANDSVSQTFHKFSVHLNKCNPTPNAASQTTESRSDLAALDARVEQSVVHEGRELHAARLQLPEDLASSPRHCAAAAAAQPAAHRAFPVTFFAEDDNVVKLGALSSQRHLHCAFQVLLSRAGSHHGDMLRDINLRFQYSKSADLCHMGFSLRIPGLIQSCLEFCFLSI